MSNQSKAQEESWGHNSLWSNKTGMCERSYVGVLFMCSFILHEGKICHCCLNKDIFTVQTIIDGIVSLWVTAVCFFSGVCDAGRGWYTWKKDETIKCFTNRRASSHHNTVAAIWCVTLDTTLQLWLFVTVKNPGECCQGRVFLFYTQ